MKLKHIFWAVLATGLSIQTRAQSTQWTSARPDGHAPIGVMGDHTHHKGEWMASYRLMHMDMEGMLRGSQSIETSDLLESYDMVPQDMSMQMHMVGLMYAPTDQLTLLVMSNYTSNDMRSRMGMMGTKMEVQGLGDLKLGALYRLFNKDRRALHLNFGLSVPFGSLTETNDGKRLGYPMQLGSGTWDANLGCTYLRQYGLFSYGFQSNYLMRLGKNDEGYALGDVWNTSFWGACLLSEEASISLRIQQNWLGSIRGNDATMGMSDMGMNDMDMSNMTKMSPVVDASNSGKTQWDLGFGANVALFEGRLKGLRFAAEISLPIAQKVTGDQMENSWCFTTGIQYTLGAN